MSAQEQMATKSPSPFTCPDCQGVLFEIRRRNVWWFECRVGHTYSAESMVDGQADNVERLLWGAVKGLEEQAEYSSRMAAWEKDNPARAKRYQAHSKAVQKQANVIRNIVTRFTDHPQQAERQKNLRPRPRGGSSSRRV
jgi:two-component system chemotaxis response regulator CheB